MQYRAIRQEILETVNKLCEAGLLRLSAGNVSARVAPGVLAITPSRLPYELMKPDDIVIIDTYGQKLEGKHRPSSETPMHSTILRLMPEVGAVVHTHSLHTMAFSATGTEIPVLTTETLGIGGPIPVSTYTRPGSDKTGQNAVDLFRERPELKCILLRNHGAIAIGPDLNSAYQNAYKLEIGAQVYYMALQLENPPVALTGEQIEEIKTEYLPKMKNPEE
jgi:L-ribulose-5-phosphate 4-epimerase